MGAYRTLTLMGALYLGWRMAYDSYLERRPPLRFYPERRVTNPHPAHYWDQVAAYETWRKVRLALETEAGWYDPRFMKKWRRRHVLVTLRICPRDLVYREWIA